MSSKPADRPKLIGLIVAIVGVFIYVLITLVPKLTGAQTVPPGEAAPPAALTPASVNAQPGAIASNNQGGATAPLPDDESDKIPPAPGHDSFTPPEGDQSHPLPTAPGSQRTQASKPAPTISGPNVAKPAVQNTAPVPAAPALPPIELKGVILGEPAVAVISVNSEVVQRQMGDQIAGGLKLVKIVETGIVLQEGKKLIPVAVGHAMPTLVPQANPNMPAAALPIVKK